MKISWVIISPLRNSWYSTGWRSRAQIRREAWVISILSEICINLGEIKGEVKLLGRSPTDDFVALPGLTIISGAPVLLALRRERLFARLVHQSRPDSALRFYQVVFGHLFNPSMLQRLHMARVFASQARLALFNWVCGSLIRCSPCYRSHSLRYCLPAQWALPI